MKGIMRVGAVALGLVAGASMAQAQGAVMPSHPVAFGVVGGATLPTGNLSDIAKTGWHAGGVVEFSVPMIPVGLKADVMYHGLGEKDQSGVKTSVITGTINGMFMVPMSSMGTVKPYVIAGVGAYNLRSKLQDGDTQSATKFGINGGAGVEFGLSGLATYIEARYHYIFSAYGSNDSYGPSSSAAAFVPISVGIMFR